MDSKSSNHKYIIKGSVKANEFVDFLADQNFKGNSLENNAYLRHDRFVKEFLPNIINTTTTPETRTVVEFGFGQASTSHALSHVFKHVHSYEINGKLLAVAEKRKSIFGLDNISFYIHNEQEVVDEALDKADKSTVFVLFAVLEHMTEEERLSTLSKIWNKMGPDNYLFIGNTPNRLSHLDLHTHEHSFLFSLPDYTCLQFLKQNMDIRYAREYIDEYNENGLKGFSLIRYRRGMGVSFHDFQIGMASNLNSCVAFSEFSFPWKIHDALLAAFFLEFDIDVPMCFAMRDMNFIMRRCFSKDDLSAIEQYNKIVKSKYEGITKQVLKQYSAM